MYFFLFQKDIKEEELAPCYFLYGEEEFLAREFIGQLREFLIPADSPAVNLERYDLQETSWKDIIDSARTVPFFFSPWRIIVVEQGEKKKKGSAEWDNQGEQKILSPKDKSLLKDYLASPAEKTVLVVVFLEKKTRSSPVFSFFSSFPSSRVVSKELRLPRDLSAWIDRRLTPFQVRMTPEAKRKLLEVAGNDLGSLDNEIKKLATYTGEGAVVEEEDVYEVSGWTGTLVDWELERALETRDWPSCLIALNKLFKSSTRPENIFWNIVKFFRDLLTARAWLEEGLKDRKTIFAGLRPYIREGMGGFYTRKFRDFFSLVESFSLQECIRFVDELGKIDWKIKTADPPTQTLLEAFLFEYCRKGKGERIKGKGQA